MRQGQEKRTLAEFPSPRVLLTLDIVITAARSAFCQRKKRKRTSSHLLFINSEDEHLFLRSLEFLLKCILLQLLKGIMESLAWSSLPGGLRVLRAGPER